MSEAVGLLAALAPTLAAAVDAASRQAFVTGRMLQRRSRTARAHFTATDDRSFDQYIPVHFAPTPAAN
nr:hypothetical protein [Streptomyces akebiae]